MEFFNFCRFSTYSELETTSLQCVLKLILARCSSGSCWVGGWCYRRGLKLDLSQLSPLTHSTYSSHAPSLISSFIHHMQNVVDQYSASFFVLILFSSIKPVSEFHLMKKIWHKKLVFFKTKAYVALTIYLFPCMQRHLSLSSSLTCMLQKSMSP